jgi:hypothetical protein
VSRVHRSSVVWSFFVEPGKNGRISGLMSRDRKVPLSLWYPPKLLCARRSSAGLRTDTWCGLVHRPNQTFHCIPPPRFDASLQSAQMVHLVDAGVLGHEGREQLKGSLVGICLDGGTLAWRGVHS